MSTKITYETGEVYEGHWNSEGRRHGTGKLTLPDSTVYCGKFHEGFFSGLGVLTLPDKSRYEGNFEKGLYNGLGVFTNSEGMKYEGEFKVSPTVGHFGLCTCVATLASRWGRTPSCLAAARERVALLSLSVTCVVPASAVPLSQAASWDESGLGARDQTSLHVVHQGFVMSAVQCVVHVHTCVLWEQRVALEGGHCLGKSGSTPHILHMPSISFWTGSPYLAEGMSMGWRLRCSL